MSVVVIFAIGVIVVLLVLSAVYRPSILLSRRYSTAILGIMFVALMVARFRRVSAFSPDWRAAGYLQTVCIVSLLVFGFMLARNNGYLTFMNSTYLGYVTNAIVGLFVLVGLALFYLSAVDSIKGATGVTGFVVNLVFALPCYIVDLARYILQEYNQSTRVVALLLSVEAALVAAWFVAPVAVRAWGKVFGRAEHLILAHSPPTYLNRQIVVPNTVHLQNPDQMANMHTMGQAQLYSIGLDLYLVPVDIGDDDPTKYAVFRYGPTGSTGGKPALFYAGADTSAQKNGGAKGHLLKFVLTNQVSSSDRSILVSVETQKWVHIQVNYANNGADVLIDGILRHHVSFSPGELPTFDASDAFIVGNNTGAAIGAVREVTYHDRPQNTSR